MGPGEPPGSVTVRELAAGDTALAAAALLELRPHLATVEALVAAVDAQREDGYRLLGAFAAGEHEASGAAGFRIGRNLAWGRFLYVDDLVTREAARGRGHAGALFAALEAEARRAGCATLCLDSGVGEDRRAAHAFYFARGMRISSHHFDVRL